MTEHESTAYESLTDSPDDVRWAYGTGFSDPLADVDTVVPAGVDGAVLSTYCAMLGDDALVMSHRLQQWVARAPELEEETALANIALDLLGQARGLLTRAGQCDGSGRSEDDFAYRRTVEQFRNVTLVEGAEADFAGLIARLLVFTTWRLALFETLRTSRDPVVAAIAAKGRNELAYHRDYAARWTVRLGDGTAVSRERMQAALTKVWPLVGELFAMTAVESELAAVGAAVDPSTVRAEFDRVLVDVLRAATLPLSAEPSSAEPAGRVGRHTSALGVVLDELQVVARAQPGATW